jgi:Plavaka transposase
VWHKAFYEIVESIEKHTELGFSLYCGDGVRRKLYPYILIVSADYEEQYVVVSPCQLIFISFANRCTIALIRGINSKFPCPICLVPGDQLTNLTDKFTLRTTESMKNVYDEAQLLNATEREKLLKEYGLRNVKVTTSNF